MSDPNLFFVYGTLLTSAEHPMGRLLRSKSRLAGKGSIQARLYIIDDPNNPCQNFYPGALPSGSPQDQVYGVTDPDGLFEAFDRYEACSPDWPEPHEFIRRRVVVGMEDRTQQTATSYLYSWDVSTAVPVRSGRFTLISPAAR